MAKREKTRFTVPNFGAKNRKRVRERWRKQRGIDNHKREGKANRGATPGIGYKNSDAVRFSRQTDFPLFIYIHLFHFDPLSINNS